MAKRGHDGDCRGVLLGIFAAAGDRSETRFHLEPDTAVALHALLAQAQKDGFSPEAMTAIAGRRPVAEKHPLAAAVIRTFGAQELTHWLAGHSEHLTGKSVDLDLGTLATIENARAGAFAKLPTYRWLRLHAREFGFNQAFPDQPWHFTHDLASGAAEDPAPGTVGPARVETVARRLPDFSQDDDALQVLTGQAVAWLPGSSTIVYLRCWREEGGGDGCALEWQIAAAPTYEGD